MRPIEFRGKRIDNGEWVYGSYHYSTNKKHHYILALEKFNERENVNQVKGLDEMCLFKTEVSEIDPSTVGQFTGLTDKNGKKIFDGDCLIYIGTNMSGMEVKFIDGAFIGEGPFNTLPLRDYINSFDFQSIEIIGNIHDNPKLLNQQQ